MQDPTGPELQRMRQVLERAVTRACPPRFADHRPDIVQAALVKILEVCRRGEAETAAGASYLWRVAYGATIDELRRIGRRREVRLDGAGEGEPSLESVPAAADDVARRALGREIQACLERLIEPRRIAATLHLCGFGSEEAARSVGWSVKRVRNLTFRGIGDLRRCLEKKGIRP